MTATIRKAVLPVAGLGTRTLPATKAIPKEMMTVVDRPAIQHVVEEAMAAGIEEFVFVTSPQRGLIDKSAIRTHFSRQKSLEDHLDSQGKHAESKSLQAGLPDPANIHYAEQDNPRGLGHAVWCARELVGNEPFALLLPDVLVLTRARSCTAQLMDVYRESGGNVIAVEAVPDDLTHRYGIVELDKGSGKTRRVTGMVEKPPKGTAPSNLAILGRYLLQPEIFDILETQEKGSGGEIQVTDAMLKLMASQTFTAVECEGASYDCGSHGGFVAANLAFALARDDLRGGLIEEIKKLK